MWSDARDNGMHEGLIVPTARGGRSCAIVRMILPEVGPDPAALPLMQSISVLYASATQSFAAPPVVRLTVPPPSS